MALTSVDLDPWLVARAREVTGERSNRAVIDLALRRLVASKQKSALVAGMEALVELELDLDALTITPVDAGPQ